MTNSSLKDESDNIVADGYRIRRPVELPGDDVEFETRDEAGVRAIVVSVWKLLIDRAAMDRRRKCDQIAARS